jgi:hypothetical protein
MDFSCFIFVGDVDRLDKVLELLTVLRLVKLLGDIAEK